MIIKRVVVQGFKTYAKKTEFVFDPGVTAIVGPNGSGKSNVADAIRWCLGEQSFSLLRSKKTSDVIFSGSDRKSRLGVAQVSVTLDNSLGELPVDFAEVEITRRAYRDGDNEYLLNGQRVRLQDITEILAPTGLGKRTYALIGQGLIERILSMAPGELRGLFEEAAGITTFQSKRTTALRRLEAAQLNLTRVQDITAEISPRLGYLRRQAERAQERNRIADELRDLSLDWYGYHWHTAQRRYDSAVGAENALRHRVETHRKRLAALSARIEERRSRQFNLRGRVGELHRVSSEHHRQAEQIGRELAVAQERLRHLSERAEAARQELAPLRLQQETLVQRIAESEQNIAGLQLDVSERKHHVDLLKATISERQTEQQTMAKRVETQRDQVAAIRTGIAQALSRSQQLEERCAEFAVELKKENGARKSAAEKASTLNSTLAQDMERLREIESRISQVQSEVNQAENSIDEVRDRLEDATQRRQIADREADRLQTRLDVLNRLRDEGAGYASGVRAVLQASRRADRSAGKDAQLQGIRGTIASAIRVPAELDKAIETALGGAYQNVIALTWADARNAISYLTVTGNGRATFLPLDRLQVLPPISPPAQSGVLGNAADLVEFDQDVSDAVLQLLNRVWIVEDLDAARRSLDTISRGPRPTVVTLGGEIVRPGGAVSGGTDGRRRDDSVLAREREIRELPEQLRQAHAVADQRAAHCTDMAAKIESLQRELPPLRESLHALRQEERVAREDRAGLEKENERAMQASDWHAARASQIQDEFSNARLQQDSFGHDLEQSRANLLSAEASLREAEQATHADGVGPLLQKLADLRTAAAEVQGNLQSQAAVLENQRRNLQSTENQIAAKDQQIVSLAGESHHLAAAFERLDRQESELSGKIASVLTEMRPSEAALEQLEAEQNQLETEERALQETLRRDESEWNAAQLSAQRADDALSQLRRDIENELGLVFLEEGDDLSHQPPLPWDSLLERLKPLESLPEGLDEKVRGLRSKLSRLRNVNPDAPREYAEAAERCEFLESQAADLEVAIGDLHEIVAKLDTLMESELEDTFAAVSEQFEHFFKVLFNGGAAKLTLMEPDNITMTGIEIIARPPGKRPQSLALLSGGERTLAACALIFAILRVSPTPFCVLDEVDAALDEANVDRFRFALDELSQDTQFILITHNRRTLEGTNAIYGVTMSDDGTSRVISLKLEGERIVEGGLNAGDEALGDTGDQLTETGRIVEM